MRRWSSYYNTKHMSPTDGFPEDFSLIITMKADVGVQGKVFTMYSDISAEEIMSLSVGDKPTFIYKDMTGAPGEDGAPVFDITLNDGK